VNDCDGEQKFLPKLLDISFKVANTLAMQMNRKLQTAACLFIFFYTASTTLNADASSWGEKWDLRLECNETLVEFNRSKQLVRVDGVGGQRFSKNKWNWFWTTSAPSGDYYEFYIFDSNYTRLYRSWLRINPIDGQLPRVSECLRVRD